MGRVAKRKVVDLVVTINYGTVNPMSWGIWVCKDNVWNRVYSYYYDSREEGKVKTDDEYADEIYRSFIKVLGFSYSDSKITFIVDPAAAGFMERLRRMSIMFVAKTNVFVIPYMMPVPKMDYINRHEIVKEISWHLSTRFIFLPFDIYKTVEEYPNRTLQEIYMFVKSLFPIKITLKEKEVKPMEVKNSMYLIATTDEVYLINATNPTEALVKLGEHCGIKISFLDKIINTLEYHELVELFKHYNLFARLSIEISNVSEDTIGRIQETPIKFID